MSAKKNKVPIIISMIERMKLPIMIIGLLPYLNSNRLEQPVATN